MVKHAIMVQENELDIINLTPNEVDDSYNMYCENNQFYDESMDLMILSDSFHYSYDDFLSILQDKEVRAIGLVERCPVQDYASNSYSYLKILKGFLVYETLESSSTYSIIFCEVESKQQKYYAELLHTIYRRLSVSKLCKKINFEVSELRPDQLKACFGAEMKKKEMVKGANNRPDTFIFEKSR